ncbi:mRNA interferase RelE/StbE [Frankia sp. AiPs1]|uniref:type II toxin-antitoxin system RelE family toxin n=1 Tax=Frankia sp. AiPa1 TaxID=573492 RepID=UPI00202B9F30|nr:type II toxin-antitoxin system RelE/ParE family toxin [Frankia sp. AiPa1]MCL9759539.1 type II toxin-antitoxin system RelE/ParE family toxin [Frankia sp. AiPa1]
MVYKVELRPLALRQLRKLPVDVRRRVERLLIGLAEDPRPHGCLPLTGRPGYRVRVGVYRVLYEVRDDVLIVTLVEIGHRREVYRDRS